jgi:ABC-type nitrate/sulfonate/bicarbonate transport system substrate-binding protein
MQPLTLTHGGALSNLPLFLAVDADLFSPEGLNVTAPPLAAFGSTAERLRTGVADLGTTGFTQVLADADDDDPLVVVAGSGLRGMAVVARPDRSDLSGARIGTFAADPMEVLLHDVLSLHRAEGVTIEPLASLAEGAGRLADGTLEAITTVEPWIGRLHGRGFAIVSDGTDVWGPIYPDTVLVTRRSFLTERPETLGAAIRAMLQAERMILEDPDHALRVTAHRFPGFSIAELRRGLEGQPPAVDLRGLQPSILGRWATVRRLGGFPASEPPSDLIDLRCLAEAVDAFPAARRRTPERIGHVH